MSLLLPTKDKIGPMYFPIWQLPDSDYKRITVWCKSTGWTSAMRKDGVIRNYYYSERILHPNYYYVGGMRK
jgi:hypothetical protein